MRALLLSFVCFVGAVGCRVGGAVEVVPLRGMAPESIAIWPEVASDPPTTSSAWFAGLPTALHQRGYRVVTDGVARQMLADAGESTTLADPIAAGRHLQVEAVLEIAVRAFEFSVERGVLENARWDVEWRLLSTRGAGVQWRYVHHGSWRRADRRTDDPLRRLDQNPDARDIVPIGGNRMPGFRDAAELIAHLNREAMQRLPAY